MIELYNLEVDSGINLMIGNIMEKIFFFLIIFLTIWIFTSLIFWLFGARIKSEKVIKFGITNFIISVIIQIFILLIPVIVAFFK